MNVAALQELLPYAGWSTDRVNDVDFTDSLDPKLPTTFRITETAAAALAAMGLAVADLWELRTGRRQTLGIDTGHATASLRSTKYLRLGGEKINTERNTVMGIYPAQAGRWNYLHCNFPNHRAAALKVLGVPEEREAVAEAVSKWDALKLEDAIIAAGGAGGMVRSAAEWAEHPQGRAIAALPLMEIVKIGDSAPEPLPEGDRPLSNLRVLDLTRVLAGPTCARTLAEQGADVMKISAPHIPFIPYQEFDTGHGKLSAHLDLRDEKEHASLLELVRGCDVFSQGYRPNTLANRGLSPTALAALRPGIICVSMCAFGHTGPWAERRGFDTAVQVVSGIAERQGKLFSKQDEKPLFYPVSAIDYLTGYLMAFGALVALRKRTLEGGSWLVRLSLAQVGRWLQQKGELPFSEAVGAAPEFAQSDLESWMMSSDTPMGHLTHLAPVVQFSETAARWDRPSVPLGHNKPAWPER